MTRAYFTQEQFNAGKLGELLRGRFDSKLYKAGCKELINFRPSVQGPAIKRKGTVHVSEVEDSSNATRLVKFIFSEIDSVVLEFGDETLRFKSGISDILEASQSITGATQADPVVITYSGSDNYANGDEVLITDVVGMTGLNNKRYLVANVDTGANTFEITDKDGNNIDGTSYTAYSSGGSIEEVYQITTPYGSSDLSKLKFAQLGDIMYIAHPDYAPRKLSRSGDTDWTIETVPYEMGPVQDINESTTTITLSGTLTEGATSTWTSSTAIFDSSDVDTVWAIAKHDDSTIVGYAKMTSFTSSTVADFSNQTDLTSVTTTASTNWNYPSWSETFGWPRAVAFHDQRLFWGGTNNAPLTIWSSVATGDYENYDIDDASADDSLVFELAGRINTIQWMASDGDFLVIGTYGGLSFISFTVGDDVVTPTAKVGTQFGSSNTQGVRINNQIVYAHSNNKSLYESKYDDLSLNYLSLDLNDYNTSILSDGITYKDTIEQPDIGVVCVAGGKLVILSRDSSRDIQGWYEYQINGYIESVCVIPTTGNDRVWLVVKRTIDGVTRRYTEYIDVSDQDIYLDSCIVYSGSATRTFSGLEHLEGEEVSVVGDGSYAGDYAVSGGSITIPDSKNAIEEAIIGLSYNADLEVMPINIPLQQTGGNSFLMMSRVNNLLISLYKTIGLQVGDGFDNLETVSFRNTSDNMDAAIPAFGDSYPEVKEKTFNGTWTRTPTICLRSNLPFPCTIVGISARMEVNTD
jgi:hypothetical protein